MRVTSKAEAIGTEEFDFLLERVRKFKGSDREIKLNDNLTLIFKYGLIREGYLFSKPLSSPSKFQDAKDEDIVSLYFDTAGRDSEYVLQVEAFRVETGSKIVYGIPPREEKDADYFQKLLSEESKKEGGNKR